MNSIDVAAILKRALGEAVRIDDVQRIRQGCCKQTYTVSSQNPDSRYILQIDQDPFPTLTCVDSKVPGRNKVTKIGRVHGVRSRARPQEKPKEY